VKAVILVGGEATRLRPLTPEIPKAMVPILNTRFLEYVFDYLMGYGIHEVVITQSQFAQPIFDYFGDGARFGLTLHYAIEETQLGTAGAIKNTASYLDDTFIGLNGDILTDLDLGAMIDFHRRHGAQATIALAPVADPSHYGLVETSPAGRVNRFLEKPKPAEITSNLINAGTYILEPAVLDWINPGVKVSIERETFPALLAAGEPVYAYASDAYWIDIGTPEKYLQLNRDLLRGLARIPAKVTRHGLPDQPASGAPLDAVCGPLEINAEPPVDARGVTLRGQVVIGEGSRVLGGSLVEDCVIWSGVSIGENVRLSRSMVADDCELGDGCEVTDAVLGRGVRVAPGARVVPGSRIAAGEFVAVE
jgi:mannose-1-phosphate guanylyltransferase